MLHFISLSKKDDSNILAHTRVQIFGKKRNNIDRLKNDGMKTFWQQGIKRHKVTLKFIIGYIEIKGFMKYTHNPYSLSVHSKDLYVVGRSCSSFNVTN